MFSLFLSGTEGSRRAALGYSITLMIMFTSLMWKKCSANTAGDSRQSRDQHRMIDEVFALGALCRRHEPHVIIGSISRGPRTRGVTE